MNKYVYIHVGFVPPTPEIGAAWMGWFESIKDRIVDSGQPFSRGAEIRGEVVTEHPLGLEALTGYTIVNAESFEEAVEVAKTCPSITGIRVYEAAQM